MQKLVFTNGKGTSIDLTDHVYYGITDWSGLSNTDLNIQTQQVPFEDGAVFLDALMEQREISVTVAIQDNNNLELRYQKKRELISALNPKLGEGVLVYTNDYLTKQIKTIPQIPLFENKNSDDSGTLKANVTFSCPSPYWEDVEETETNIQINQVATITNNGDVPAQIEIELRGGAVNPKIINMTSNKHISLEGTIENTIINTNLGKKSVLAEAIDFEWLTGMTFEDFATDGINTVYGGTGLVYEDVEGNRQICELENYSVGVTFAIWGVAYGNGIFVASTHGSVYFTSFDGKNWQRRNLQEGFGYTLAFGNGVFVTKGDYSTGAYSTDGINWISVSGPGSWVSFTNGRFITISTSFVATSTDGINWTAVATAGDSYSSPRRTIYANGYYYCAVAGGIIRSSDLTNWTKISLDVQTIWDIAYYNNIFIAGGITTTNQQTIFVSSDGENWENPSGLDFDINLQRLKYINNKFILVGDNGTIIETLDGINFTKDVFNFVGGQNYEVYDVEYGNNIYVAVGGRTGREYFIAKSTDGKVWEETYYRTGAGTDGNRVIYGNGMFVVIFYSRDFILYSSDGENWTLASGIARVQNFGIYAKDMFVLVGNGGRIYTSPDGINWTSRTSGTSNDLYGIDYINGVFIAVGASGTMIKSTDGINWTTQTLSITGNIGGITHSLDKVVAKISGGGQLISYNNGSSWTLFGNGTGTQGITPMYYGHGLFWTGRTYSADGITWSGIKTKMGSLNVNSKVTNNEVFLLSLRYAIILKSYASGYTNEISKLGADSDMNLNLKQGENRFVLTTEGGDVKAIVKYRQKYIGV